MFVISLKHLKLLVRDVSEILNICIYQMHLPLCDSQHLNCDDGLEDKWEGY